MFESAGRGGSLTAGGTSYPAEMAVSAHDVAAALRSRLAGVATVKLHKLLYYCQGHHLATFSRPLFREAVSAWDMGPVVGALWHAEKHGGERPPPAALDEAALNTIGYVISRYGALTGTDLMHLSHSEDPWRLADAHRQPGTAVPISPTSMREYFKAADADDELALDAQAVSEWLHDAERTRDAPGRRDEPAEIAARIDRLRECCETR